MEAIVYHLRLFGYKLLGLKVRLPRFFSREYLLALMGRVRSIGLTRTMEEYDQRKLSIFNQLNFFQLITGIFISLLGLLSSPQMPLVSWLIASLPAMVSVVVLYLNKLYKHEAALLVYFLLYPFVTCVIYLSGLNLGISLFFVFYGILSVFFLKDIGYIIFSLCFSMVSFFILSVVLKHYWYDLRELNNNLYLFNHCLAIAFIFYGLFLIKKENADYQTNMLAKNLVLQEKKERIEEQSEKLRENAALLKRQASEMAEVNTLKNKLFSIISHDLKAPLYALRNLFADVHQKKMSSEELKEMVPEVLNDLNYTVGLMDNLLQWAKAQMQSHTINAQEVDIEKSIHDVLQLLHQQAKAKRINIQNSSLEGLYGYADKDMINLVLRNLISNAIKFTPVNGNIIIGVHEHDAFLEIYVQDSGMGISPEMIARINNNNFFTTKGTASEAGTGLGLMLCRDFLSKNGGQLHIESEPGTGSTFSFTIPKYAEDSAA